MNKNVVWFYFVKIKWKLCCWLRFMFIQWSINSRLIRKILWTIQSRSTGLIIIRTQTVEQICGLNEHRVMLQLLKHSCKKQCSTKTPFDHVVKNDFVNCCRIKQTMCGWMIHVGMIEISKHKFVLINETRWKTNRKFDPLIKWDTNNHEKSNLSKKNKKIDLKL